MNHHPLLSSPYQQRRQHRHQNHRVDRTSVTQNFYADSHIIDSDSSDWSSDEEESKDSGGLMPSSHTSLLSNWEWRATHGLDSPGKTRRFPSAGNASGEESATSSSPKMPPKSPGK